MTGNELAVREVNVAELQQTAKLLVMSGFFDTKGTLEAAVAQLATKILAGREYGFGPYASATGIHVIQGKPTLSGNLLATMVKSSGKYNYKVVELSDTMCKIEFFEGKTSVGVSSFSEADAKRAGTQNMGKFPRNMLFNRALSNGVRWYCPDVTNGSAVYVPEDFGSETDNEGNVVEVSMTVTPAVHEYTKPDKASVATLKQMHAAGAQLMTMAMWKERGPDLIVEVTGVKPAELTEEQATEVIAYLNSKITEKALTYALDEVEELAD